MKNYLLPLLFSFLLISTLSSCIKEEAPNAEADIENATLENAPDILQTQPNIGNNTIIFRLRKFSGNYIFAPEFTLTPGAKIEPENGTKRDFFEPQEYTVTSEDGLWSKTYKVSFMVDDATNYAYPFENVEVIETESPEGRYHVFFDFLPNQQKAYNWSSGNEGYNILAATLLEEGEELKPEFYPTSQTSDGYIGKAVKMQTKDTGPLGGMVGSPLAAGNLFIGTFNLTFPAIKSTHFGWVYPYGTAPKAIKGYFKYKAGKDFLVNGPSSALTKDTWDAYAILFEKTDGEDNYLSGDHNFEDARMVSLARITEEERIETEEWTSFEIPFQLLEGKTFDPDKEYMYTIVFSSSLEGDQFNGAVGSTLWIDEVQLITE